MSLPQREAPGARAWPPITYEDRAWASTIPTDLLSRAARERMQGPYGAAVVPEIGDLTPTPSRGVAEAAEQAAAAIRSFDADSGVDVAPFAAVLLRSESASSSQIENITSGARHIALAEINEETRSNAALVVSNTDAMRAALMLADGITPESILSMHHALLRSSAPEIAGRWRDAAVWVGGNGYSPHGASFVAPSAERVGPAIADLVRFAGRNDLPALTQAAVAHAQFETIHPFPDGNGRTGRALVHSMLRRRAVTRAVTVPVSAGLLTDTDRYFDALTAYRGGDVDPIVETLAEAAIASVANGQLLVADLRTLRQRWTDSITARSDSAVWKIVDLLLRQPVISTAVVMETVGINHTNASRAIDRLLTAGILSEVSGRRRSQLWQSTEVIQALDGFASRTGRRAAPSET
ncbi:Fic family protein [Sanguibacter sp. 4.1]|uniref:Fic family protein n=1 Tax=Sanguibacter biliveldensis TaxID=3030830 RepID=A0AAF0Z867_9MICO|nr:Fic family protein [Sanguibacter sp. 4.1]WPF81928.1 Fic family protein [Sanguibacter sp. 4.1]